MSDPFTTNCDPGDEQPQVTAAPEPPIELIITDDGILPVKAV